MSSYNYAAEVAELRCSTLADQLKVVLLLTGKDNRTMQISFDIPAVEASKWMPGTPVAASFTPKPQGPPNQVVPWWKRIAGSPV